MGKKKSTSTQTNRPVYAAEVEGANRQQQEAYNQARPMLNQVSNNMGQASIGIFDSMNRDGNAVSSANRFLVGQLEGDPQQNPYLDAMIDRTNNSVRNQMQARLGRMGASGGSDYTNLITRALASNEGSMRFEDYNNAMNRKFQAAGMSALPVTTAAGLGQAGAMLPLQGALANSAGTAGLLGQYQTVNGRQTQTGGLLESILGGAFQLGAAALCDIRAKENIQWVGMTPAGLPLYRFDYIGGEKGVIGPMAQEVAILQPEALGPVVDGFMTVIPGMLQ